MQSNKKPSDGKPKGPGSYTITADSDPAEVRAFFQSIAVKKSKRK